MVTRFLFLVFSSIAAFVFVGCDTPPRRADPIVIERLDGSWIGSAEAGFGDARTSCSIKVPIAFVVRDGRAVSLIRDRRAEFDVAIDDNGKIAFKYEKAVKHTSDYPHTSLDDIHFIGYLSEDEGSGHFTSSGCAGKWYVKKVRAGPDAPAKSGSVGQQLLPRFIKMSRDCVVYEFGMPKFTVHKGDSLAVLSRKTCRTGHGECWKVRATTTGEIGYVYAPAMYRDHELVYE